MPLRRTAGRWAWFAVAVALAVSIGPLIHGLFLFASALLPLAVIVAALVAALYGGPTPGLRRQIVRTFVVVTVLILLVFFARGGAA